MNKQIAGAMNAEIERLRQLAAENLEKARHWRIEWEKNHATIGGRDAEIKALKSRSEKLEAALTDSEVVMRDAAEWLAVVTEIDTTAMVLKLNTAANYAMLVRTFAG